ncbi:general substrate transporter [Daedalea quercina L-15889]|uniref:General substrate transporter n=1 Tax=Daedalea quercina L-15889 TaxID=1314783 RepID=A0A165UGB2_9APHY|nr:general substrate transporter [Daedalea quercina L-15889]
MVRIIHSNRRFRIWIRHWVTAMPHFVAQFSKTYALSTILQGLIVSIFLLTASMASLVSGSLSNRISRTRKISLGAFIFAAGSANSALQARDQCCTSGDVLPALARGYSCHQQSPCTRVEIAQAFVRGRLGSMVQLICTMGIASGYFVCYGTVRIPTSLPWRFPFGLQAVIFVVLAVGALFSRHSPRWLRHVGRAADADAAWIKLYVGSADAQKTEENASRGEAPGLGWWQEAQQLWKKDSRVRTALGISLMGMQQASGIDGVIYVVRPRVVFSQAGLSASTASFVASGVSGLINFACTFVVQFFADEWGRRASMIRGGTVIGLSMILIGALYASRASETPLGRWTIIVLIYIFVVGFTMSWGIVTRILIQPMGTRAAATSLGQCANWTVNWIIAFTTSIFLARTSSGPYFLFGCCSLLTTLVCLASWPETRGASLEEVDKAFEIAPWRGALKKRWGRFCSSDTGVAEVHELAPRSRHLVIMPGHGASDRWPLAYWAR